MTHAYDKTFLPDAMRNLGFAFDCAVNHCGTGADDFYDFFVASRVADAFSAGVPKYVCGMSGTELALTVFERVGLSVAVGEYCAFERTPAYWAGWILAFYQWHSALSFATIRGYVTASQVMAMYHPLHEAPEEKFIDVMDGIIARAGRPTNLHRLRTRAGLTQRELSERSGVNLRTLQQYETRLKDINRASGESINALARALCCNFYDVMEL